MATSVDYCKQLIIDPTVCGSRFSTGRLLAIEDFTVSLEEVLEAVNEMKFGEAPGWMDFLWTVQRKVVRKCWRNG